MKKKEIFTLTYNGCEVVVSEVTRDGAPVEYEVEWTDFDETFHSLSLAVARVSALIACGESNWQKGFLQQNVGFINKAEEFLTNVVK